MSNNLSTNPVPITTSLPIPEGYAECLPPWTIEGEAWWILPPIPLPWQTKELPRGVLGPLEAGRLADLQAAYMGG